MTGTDMQTFETDLLGGAAIGDTLFYVLANMQKGLIEASRDWMILRAFDNSQSFSTSDDYQTTKPLPANFSRTYSPYDAMSGQQPAVFLVDSSGFKYALNPIPFASRYDKKDVDGFYYLDMLNNAIGRTGSQAGTLHLYFIQNTADLDAGRTWEFPVWAHPLIPLNVAVSYKGGIDYDLVNASQTSFNRADAQAIVSRLAFWDAQLQQQELGV